MEANKIFAKASTSRSQEKPTEETNLSMISTFLETCMKLLRDSKVVKGLRELINRCVGKENSTNEPRVVRKLGKHKARTGREMRLTV